MVSKTPKLYQIEQVDAAARLFNPATPLEFLQLPGDHFPCGAQFNG